MSSLDWIPRVHAEDEEQTTNFRDLSSFICNQHALQSERSAATSVRRDANCSNSLNPTRIRKKKVQGQSGSGNM